MDAGCCGRGGDPLHKALPKAMPRELQGTSHSMGDRVPEREEAT